MEMPSDVEYITMEDNGTEATLDVCVDDSSIVRVVRLVDGT